MDENEKESAQDSDVVREYKKGLTVSHRVRTHLDLEHGIKQEIPVVEFAFKSILCVVPVDIALYLRFPKEFDKAAATLMRKAMNEIGPQIVQTVAMMPKRVLKQLLAGGG